MNRLKNIWDNFTILMEVVIKYPKTSIVLLVALLGTGYYFGSKVPNALTCTWESVVTQSIPSELWRFNWYSGEYEKQCQYFNGKRWISQNKVIDVGDSSDIEE